MARVTGLGGVFYKVADPAATQAWYQENLGIGCASDHFRGDGAREDLAITQCGKLAPIQVARVECVTIEDNDSHVLSVTTRTGRKQWNWNP